jgi:L-iditol 2-dehydrogenase
VRAAVYRGPGQVVAEDVPEPALAAGDVLIEVTAAGVCGTDVRIWKGEHRAAAPGRTPGHEVVGRVAGAAGPLPARVTMGAPVFVAPNIGCGGCRQCARGQENLCAAPEALGITLDGAFAERMAVPARAVARGNLIRLTGSPGPEMVLAEPLACVLRGQDKAGPEVGESALVFGAGPVGLLHIALAKARGAVTVVCSEPSAPRRAAALRAGATLALDPAEDPVAEAMGDLTDGIGPDVVITAAPVHALQTQALELAAPGGRVLLFGGLPKSKPTVAMDTNLIHYKELAVVGSTASNLDDCRRAAALIEGGVVDTSWMVSGTYGLDQIEQAVAAARDPSSCKTAIIPKLEVRRP